MTDSRLAWAYLSRVAEAPSWPLVALVRSVGAVDAAELVRRGAVGAELDRVTSARREVDSAAADLDRIGRLGGRLVTPDDPDWPFAPFAHFAGVDVGDHPNGIAPLALWVIGAASLSTVSGRAAAVVRTRAAIAREWNGGLMLLPV